MGNQGNRSNYLAAFEGANHQLEYIYSEYHDLQRRKEKLEGVLTALEPFLQSVSNFNQESYAAEPVPHEPDHTYAEPTYAEQYSAPQQPVAEPCVRGPRDSQNPLLRRRFPQPNKTSIPSSFASTALSALRSRSNSNQFRTMAERNKLGLCFSELLCPLDAVLCLVEQKGGSVEESALSFLTSRVQALT